MVNRVTTSRPPLRQVAKQYNNLQLMPTSKASIAVTKPIVPSIHRNASIIKPNRCRNTKDLTKRPATKSSVLTSANLSYRSAYKRQEDYNVTDVLDQYIEQVIAEFKPDCASSVPQLFSQYREKARTVVDRIIPYEEHPISSRRADSRLDTSSDSSEIGDGLVLVVHVSTNLHDQTLDKVCTCSGFVVKAIPTDNLTLSTETIITCAHTLEEMHRYLQRSSKEGTKSFSLIITANGEPRVVMQVLSSLPRSDIIALEIAPSSTSSPPLRSLPLSPFPVYTGSPVLTHLLGSPNPPEIQRSRARVAAKVEQGRAKTQIEEPIEWFGGRAWRRWGRGTMLGYRSYTGLEIEAGISSVLPHIMTSILPTSGSSGGPLINANTGSVVGMISGRRMDNRVEGERGWGASAEGIFEMFALPGFVPASRRQS